MFHKENLLGQQNCLDVAVSGYATNPQFYQVTLTWWLNK